VQNKCRQTIYGIVSLILFSGFVLSSEVLVFSYDGLGNIGIEKLLADTSSQQPTKQVHEKDSQQIPHNHITLGHLYSLEESYTEISIVHPSAAAGIQPQTLSIQLSENLPNAHLHLSHQKFPHQILSQLSHIILQVHSKPTDRD